MSFYTPMEQGNMPEGLQEIWLQRQQAREQYSKTKSDLDEALSQRSQTPMLSTKQLQLKDSEIEELRRQLDFLKAQIQRQEQVLQNQSIRIQQQAETIHVHSQEMSKPRVDKMSTTPFRGYSGSGDNDPNPMRVPPPMYSQAVPSATGQGSYQTKWGTIVSDQPQNRRPSQPTPVATFPSNSTNSIQSPRQKRGNVYAANDQGSPIPVSQMNNLSIRPRGDTGSNIFATPSHLAQGQLGPRISNHTPSTSTSPGQGLLPPAPPQSPVRPDSAASKARSTRSGALIPALIPYLLTPKDDSIVQQWKRLFDMAIKFAYDHVNVPSNQWDSKLPQGLKNRLMAAATKTTAARLLSTQNTRFFLVARIILEWIDRFVFKEDSFAGLDPQTDHAIKTTRSKIFSDTPAPIKFVFLRDIATSSQKLRNHANYQDFLNTRSHERATQLWNFIRPLKFAQTDGDWEDMHNLMQEAHKVAELQLCDVAEYRFFFNNANDSFNSVTMINMDDQFGYMSDDEVMARKGAVRLSVVPQVMSRITSAEGQGNTRVLLKAGVLVKFKDHMIKDLLKKRN